MISKAIRSRAKKAGLPPGTLMPLSNISSEITISAIDFDATTFEERKNISLQGCLDFLRSPANTWINICGVNDPKIIAAIGQHFGLHPLMLEDIMSIGARSKMDDYKETLFLILSSLTYNNVKHKVDEEQVSIVLGKNFVISFTQSKNDLFAPVRDRLRNPKGQIRLKGADYLCYALVDCIVDSYFLMLEQVDGNLDELEEELVHSPTPKTLLKIQRTKKEVTMLRRLIWPVRELISSFRRTESLLVQDSTKIYIQDVYDHTIQAIDTIEGFRDIASGMLDLYLSTMTFRMNEIMKFLTVVGTIFLPLTFITSYFGMNFDMPEFHWKWGYPFAIAVMLAMTGSMIYYFRRKKWI